MKAKRLMDVKTVTNTVEAGPRRGAIEKCTQTKGHYLRDAKKAYVKDLTMSHHGVWEEWPIRGVKKLVCVNNDEEKDISPHAVVHGINTRRWLSQ